MVRVIRYSAIFALSAFALLLPLRLALIIFELPSFTVSGTPTIQALGYLGMAAGTVTLIAPIIVLGMIGSALGFWLMPRNRFLRTGVIVGAGGMFALTMFFLNYPAIRLIGEVLWLISVVAIAGVLGYATGRVFSQSGGTVYE